MSNSYKVSGSNYGGYPNYAYNGGGQEMSEYRHGAGISSKNGSGNGNYAGNSHNRNTSVSNAMGANSKSHSSGSAAAAALADEDDEYDRGHWGSKAEFILSCIGFSVRPERME